MDEPQSLTEPDDLLRAKLTTETAKIAWQGLQRFFAQGLVIHVQRPLDLVEVAFVVTRDDKARLSGWMEDQRVAPVSDADARTWIESDASVWCVVVKPWLLVQSLEEPGVGNS